MIYVYDMCNQDGWLGRVAATVLCVRFGAYSGPWPRGRMLAYGWTPEHALQRARKALAQTGKPYVREVLRGE